MENYIVKEFEKRVHDDLYDFLVRKEAIDKHLPECPDVEEKWREVCSAYLPDGAREFQQYPVVSLGWMMFIGMALAYYWDTDWEKYGPRTGAELYDELRDRNGYDNLDDTVIKDLLGYDGEKGEMISDMVAQCASRVNSMLSREHLQGGTEEAFGCYMAALHQLYIMGMAVELNALGYHMTPFTPPSMN